MNESTATLPAVNLSAPLGAAAQRYATAGIPVFPCVPGGKSPATEHGFHDATTNPSQIAQWWRRQPNANIGIPTGAQFDVLDIDVHPGGDGFPALRRLRRAGLLHGWEMLVGTPSGGLHLYFPADPARALRSWSRSRVHVDFRGEGGYIIAPPSRVVVAGAQHGYEVLARSTRVHPIDGADVRRRLTPITPACVAVGSAAGSQVGVQVVRIAAWVAGAQEGGRNSGLFWAACRLAELGISEAGTIQVLEPAATRAGLGPDEVHRTIHSAHSRHAVEAGPTSVSSTPASVSRAVSR